MGRSINTNVQLTPELRLQLDHASQRLHRGINWIINQALEDYLQRLGENKFINEAKKQSLLARDADPQNKELTDWESEGDHDEWK